MDCHNKRRSRLAAAVGTGLLLILLATSQAADEQPATAPPANVQSPNASQPAASGSATTRAIRHDAALADIYFVNSSLGWAVGDRGVIWHTDDGGSTWQQQASLVSCNLRCRLLRRYKRGWAVGGESQLGRAGTRGVVLRTDDGGTTWAQIPRLVLPRLKWREILRPRTRHRLRRMRILPSIRRFCHARRRQHLAATARRRGRRLARRRFSRSRYRRRRRPGRPNRHARQAEARHSPLANASLRSFRAMRLVAPTGGWAVGDGGL